MRRSPTDFALAVREAPQDMISGIDGDADGRRYIGHMYYAADIALEIRYLTRWHIVREPRKVGKGELPHRRPTLALGRVRRRHVAA